MPRLTQIVLSILTLSSTSAFSFVKIGIGSSCSSSSSGSGSSSVSPRRLQPLFYTDDKDGNNGPGDLSNNNNNSKVKSATVRRTSIHGISVSPRGFVILLNASTNDNNNNANADGQGKGKGTNSIILPIRITSDDKDAVAATTAESLTLCQLLSGVDMAGAILSPDVFRNIVGLYSSPSLIDNETEDGNTDDNTDTDTTAALIIEDELGLESNKHEHELKIDIDFENVNDEIQLSVQQFVHNFLATTLNSAPSFEDANSWQRSRATFPKISLDSIKIDLPTDKLMGTGTGTSSTEETSSQLWQKRIIDESIKRSAAKKEDDAMNHELDYGRDLLVPMPFQYVLECRIDGDKTLDIPLYSEIDVMKNGANTDTDAESESDVTMDAKRIIHNELEESANIMEQVLYSYDDQCSGAFISMALALRYKCPVVITSRALDAIESVQNRLSNMYDMDMSVCMPVGSRDSITSATTDNDGTNDIDDDDDDDDDEDQDTISSRQNLIMTDTDEAIKRALPRWASISKLQSQSQRVETNIQQGFQVTKLQGALRIALQKGDDLAAEKIRAAINKIMGNDD